MFFSHFSRGSMTSLPQPLHLILKSIPTRSTVNSLLPQGWGFFIRSTSPSRLEQTDFILYTFSKDLHSPPPFLLDRKKRGAVPGDSFPPCFWRFYSWGAASTREAVDVRVLVMARAVSGSSRSTATT